VSNEPEPTTNHETVYVIDGQTYRLVKDLSWQQTQWLGMSVLKGLHIHRIDYPTAHDVIRTDGPLAMAICLVDARMELKQHNRLPWSAIQERDQVFRSVLMPQQVMEFTLPFFQRLQAASVAQLTPGAEMLKLYADLAAQSPAPSRSGSTSVSSLSVEETLLDLLTSSPSGDPPTPSPISSGASNGTPSTEPSLAGAALNCPG
jgi:hypothetical protein